MKVAVNLAGYSLADADSLRRAVKKRNTDLFKNEKHRFVFEKAPHHGVDAATAEELWQQVSRFASYSYCKAHASVYGRLAWITARLKAHFPCEFYAAALNCHKSMYPKRVFVWDAVRHGIPVLPPDINASEVQWTPTPRGIRAGLDIIRGLRRSLLLEVVTARKRGAFPDINDLRQRVHFRANELERLVLAGACRSLGDREEMFAAVRHAAGNHRQPLLFALPEEQIPSLIEAELCLTGIPFTRHPVSGERNGICRAEDMNRHVNREVWMLGILDAVKTTRTKQKSETSRRAPREMSFVTLEDESGMFELVLFPDTHDQYGHLFQSIGPYLVYGTIRAQWDSLTLEISYAEYWRGGVCGAALSGTQRRQPMDIAT